MANWYLVPGAALLGVLAAALVLALAVALHDVWTLHRQPYGVS